MMRTLSLTLGNPWYGWDQGLLMGHSPKPHVEPIRSLPLQDNFRVIPCSYLYHVPGLHMSPQTEGEERERERGQAPNLPFMTAMSCGFNAVT